MTNSPQTEADLCVVCGKPVRGDFTVSSGVDDNGTAIVGIERTPDNDFNVCDVCNDAVHFRCCSKHPESGYCDKCFERIGPDADAVL